MLRLRDNLLINESQIVTAEFDANNTNLKLAFTVPITIAPDTGKPNQVTLYGFEAEQVWHNLSENAIDIRRKQSSVSATTLVGQHPQLNNM